MGNLLQSPGAALLPGTPGPGRCSQVIGYPKRCFAGGRVRVQTRLLSSGRSHVEEKRFGPSFLLNWDLVLVWSPALLLQRAGFLDVFYTPIQILLGNQLGFFPGRKNHLWVSPWAVLFLSLWWQVLTMPPRPLLQSPRRFSLP